MKKKIIIVSILIVVVIGLVLIPTKIYQKIFNKDDIAEETNEPTTYQTLFVKDQNQYLVGVDVPVEMIEEDVVCQKWDLLTKDVMTLPNGYSSPIDINTVLINHEVNENILTLNVSEDFLNSEGRSTIECLAWNYCIDGITEVVVKIEDQVVNNLNNYYFSKITKSIGVNMTYESAYLFEADFVTVIHHEDDYIKPVTYYFDSENDLYEYTINKIFKYSELSEMVSGNNYSYTIEEDLFVINFEYSSSLSENLINTITQTIEFNFETNGIMINGTDAVLLDISFNDDTNI